MAEIRDCGRTMAGDFVAFDIRWDGDLSADVVWSMLVSGSESGEVLQLGYRLDGGTPSQFVLDQASGRRQEVDADADVRDHEITVRFPANVVGVAVEWPVWRAVLTLDGVDVAEKVAAVA